MSSVRYLACIFLTKPRWKRCYAWELDEVGDLSSCNWCILLFVGFALGKTRAGVGGARCKRTDNAREGVGGASRCTGGSASVSVIGSRRAGSWGADPGSGRPRGSPPCAEGAEQRARRSPSPFPR